jgi:multicomponent Na+:H+ antiporter subunit A
MQTVVGPAVKSIGFEWNAPVSWLGLLSGRADPHVTAGALIVLAALLLGFITYRITRPRIRKTVMVFTGGDPLQADDRVGAADFSEMAGAAFKPLYRVNPDPAYIALWRGVRGAGVALQRAAAPALERHPLVAAGVIGLATLIVVWVV